MDEKHADRGEAFVNKKIMVVGVLLIVAFLAGFIPQYVKGKRLERELGEARQENSLAQLRDLASLAYLQASQKDYGLAGGTSTRFFDLALLTAVRATSAETW